MTKFITLMVAGVLMTGIGFGYEVTLGSDPVVVVAETKAVAVSEFVKRTNGMTVAAGDIRGVHGRAYVAAVGGVTSTALQTNIVDVITNVAATVTIQTGDDGTPDPDVRGTYGKQADGIWTNGAFAVWIVGTNYVVGDTAEAGSQEPAVVYFEGSTLETMAAVDATGSVDAMPVDSITEITEVVFAAIPTGDRIVDGAVTWVIVPQTRSAVYLKSVSGDAVLVDARGNRIYAETLPGYRGAIFGTSTNAAVVNVFWH